MVRALRSSVRGARVGVPRLPSRGRDVVPRTIRLRWAGSHGHPPPEIRRLARRGGRAGAGDGDGGCAARRRRHLGATGASTSRRARLRPGAPPGAGGGPGGRAAGSAVASAIGGGRIPGAPQRSAAPLGPAGRLRRHRTRARSGAAGGRRPHHGHDGGGVQRVAPGGRRSRGPSTGGGPIVRWACGHPQGQGRPATCLYSAGPSLGSVVARGSSPVVDASRGRNDPRKATVGR